jgi:hypothetical protein
VVERQLYVRRARLLQYYKYTNYRQSCAKGCEEHILLHLLIIDGALVPLPAASTAADTDIADDDADGDGDDGDTEDEDDDDADDEDVDDGEPEPWVRDGRYVCCCNVISERTGVVKEALDGRCVLGDEVLCSLSTFSPP